MPAATRIEIFGTMAGLVGAVITAADHSGVSNTRGDLVALVGSFGCFFCFPV